MRQINKILAVLNPTSEQQLALDKAVFISQQLGADIIALICRNHASREFLGSLDARLSEISAQGIKVDLEVSEEKDTLGAILHSPHRSGCDLCIKEPHATSLGDSIFTPLDWKLLRTHVSPVLMTRGGPASPTRPIIAAIDARPADSDHQQLNASILETANLVAALSKSPLHLVSAYPSPMQDAARRDQVPALLAREYRNTCQALAAPYGVGSQQIHVAPGPAELLLPQLADQLNARLLILGTVARSGLQGALLGNTAEQILERINTDVLVLPPPSTE